MPARAEVAGFVPSDTERSLERAALERDAALEDDPARRRRHGVVHTPAALARAIVARADELLRAELGLSGGVADPTLSIVDPACGPGAFLAAALAQGADAGGAAPAAVLGLDLDADAVARAGALLSGPFARAGWPLSLATADTLGDPRWLEHAGDGPVLVLGNPPWAGSAQPAPAPFLAALLDELRRDHAGEPLGERKVGVLADPYVRFLCWAMERTRRSSAGGVLALVTNGSFLDGPVHRGLRARMLERFDRLWVVDLGGNALLSRRGPRDENVFGVRPSVAITFAVRRPGPGEARGARVLHTRLSGARDDKLATLLDGDALRRCLSPIDAAPPSCRFTRDPAVSPEYARGVSLADAMPFHREGVQTNRDGVVVDADAAHLRERLERFVAGERTSDLERANTPLRHYDPERARSAVADALEAEGQGGPSPIRPLSYRPFDDRFFAAVAPLCHRPRPALLAAMAQAPLALVSVRKDRGDAPWAHFGAVAGAVDNCFLSPRSSCRTRAFPVRTPTGADNLDPELAARLAERAERPVDAGVFLRYALATLASERFRAAHDAALRQDYPRVPLPGSRAAFDAAVALGGALVQLFCDPEGAAAAADSEPPADLRLGHHRLPDSGPAGRRAARLAELIARADALAGRAAQR